jgi:pilus assembly protein CpaF
MSDQNGNKNPWLNVDPNDPNFDGSSSQAAGTGDKVEIITSVPLGGQDSLPASGEPQRTESLGKGASSYLEEDPDDAAQKRQMIIDAVIDEINLNVPAESRRQPTREERGAITQRIRNAVVMNLRRFQLSNTKKLEDDLVGELARRLMGLGFLDLLLPGENGMGRNDLSEIAVYSSGLVQKVKKGSVRWENVDLHPSAGEIDRVIDLILGEQNKQANEVNPSVNAKLRRTKANPGGGRVKVIHKSIVPPGLNNAVNIRLYEQKPVDPQWLLDRKLMLPEMMEEIKAAMTSGKRIIITGETRTVKTTLLSAACNYLPAGWRIVKIEDPEEIWVPSPTVQTIEARPQAIGTEVMPYTLADGVDDAMRMSPDYLVIGEVRDGKAAMALFRALMTGHSGACTFHAANEHEAAARMATIMGADVGIRRMDANQMFADAIDMLIQITIPHHDVRRLAGIYHVNQELKGGEVNFTPIWKFDPSSTKESPRWVRVGE